MPFSLYLHHQVHIAFVVITGHWRVGTDNQLPVNFNGQIDVLPWKKQQRSTFNASRAIDETQSRLIKQ